MQNYKVFGREPISVVVEMGLGAALSEWIPFAKQIQNEYGVLLYERAGVNHSPAAGTARTPMKIARELHELLQQVEHKDKLILIGHSQGGLYAQQFCRLYPECVEKVILLDPLSAEDNRFKDSLTPEEYKKSGVDKSANFVIMRKLAKLRLGWIMKAMLKKAPPFYYYTGYTKEEAKDILGVAGNVTFIDTVMEEYKEAHMVQNISHLVSKGDFPDIPLVLITHSSELGIVESMQFGQNTREFAEKVENMWQDIMKRYLDFSSKSQWIRAEKSTHFIHLQEPELVIKAMKAE